MTLSEAITRAVENDDAQAAAVVVDVCRFRAGMNYDQTFTRVRKQYPTLEPADWEALLYESEALP